MDKIIKQETCIKCQKCCRGYFYIKTAYKYNLELEEFYNAIGFKVQKWFDDENEAFLEIAFYHECINLSPAGCAIYVDRPQICRDFNGTKPVNDGWGNTESCLLE